MAVTISANNLIHNYFYFHQDKKFISLADLKTLQELIHAKLCTKVCVDISKDSLLDCVNQCCVFALTADGIHIDTDVTIMRAAWSNLDWFTSRIPDVERQEYLDIIKNFQANSEAPTLTEKEKADKRIDWRYMIHVQLGEITSEIVASSYIFENTDPRFQLITSPKILEDISGIPPQQAKPIPYTFVLQNGYTVECVANRDTVSLDHVILIPVLPVENAIENTADPDVKTYQVLSHLTRVIQLRRSL